MQFVSVWAFYTSTYRIDQGQAGSIVVTLNEEGCAFPSFMSRGTHLFLLRGISLPIQPKNSEKKREGHSAKMQKKTTKQQC